MKQFAHVENGIVATISEAESIEFAFGGIELDPVEHASISIGDLYNGSVFSKPAPQPKTLAEKRRDIDMQRDATINSGFTHDGTLWHCDPTFQAQIQGFILAYSVGVLPTSATVTIRSKANTNRQLSQAQIVALAAALMQHVQGIYITSWAAKDAL